jgi:hypothetical protein
MRLFHHSKINSIISEELIYLLYEEPLHVYSNISKHLLYLKLEGVGICDISNNLMYLSAGCRIFSVGNFREFSKYLIYIHSIHDNYKETPLYLTYVSNFGSNKIIAQSQNLMYMITYWYYNYKLFPQYTTFLKCIKHAKSYYWTINSQHSIYDCIE